MVQCAICDKNIISEKGKFLSYITKNDTFTTTKRPRTTTLGSEESLHIATYGSLAYWPKVIRGH